MITSLQHKKEKGFSVVLILTTLFVVSITIYMEEVIGGHG